MKNKYKIYVEPAYGKDKSCQIKYKIKDGKIYIKDYKIFKSEKQNETRRTN